MCVRQETSALQDLTLQRPAQLEHSTTQLDLKTRRSVYLARQDSTAKTQGSRNPLVCALVGSIVQLAKHRRCLATIHALKACSAHQDRLHRDAAVMVRTSQRQSSCSLRAGGAQRVITAIMISSNSSATTLHLFHSTTPSWFPFRVLQATTARTELSRQHSTLVHRVLSATSRTLLQHLSASLAREECTANFPDRLSQPASARQGITALSGPTRAIRLS